MFEALLAGTAVLDARNNTHSSYSYAYKVEYARKSWAVLRTSAQPIYHPFSIQHIMLLYEDKIAYVLHEHWEYMPHTCEAYEAWRKLKIGESKKKKSKIHTIRSHPIFSWCRWRVARWRASYNFAKIEKDQMVESISFTAHQQPRMELVFVPRCARHHSACATEIIHSCEWYASACLDQHNGSLFVAGFTESLSSRNRDACSQSS